MRHGHGAGATAFAGYTIMMMMIMIINAKKDTNGICKQLNELWYIIYHQLSISITYLT